MATRYIIAQAKPDALKKATVNVGVIAQSSTTIKCRFATNISSKVSGNLSSFIFDNLNETYEDHFSKKEGVRVYSDTEKKYLKVSPLQTEYLHFIQNINKHQLRFGDIKETKEEDVDKVLEGVYKKEVARYIE